MSETRGFIDLRVGHGAGGIGDDSVWPSFTDIMTVIVMIFLMALVVIMVRNFELDRELLSTTTTRDVTIEVNQDLVRRLIQIEAALRDSKSEKGVLEINLSVALKRLSVLLLEQQALTKSIEKGISEREQLQQTNTLLEQQQETAESEISALTKSEQALSQHIENLIVQLSKLKSKSSEQIARLTDDKTSLGDALAAVELSLQQARSKNVTLTQEATELKTLSRIASEEVLALATLIKQRGKENEALLAQATTSAQQFRSLQEEYEALDDKYRDLIRPARNTAGKQVATVWIEKSAAGLRYKMKQPGQAEPQVIDEQQMHRALQALKTKFGNLLYVKVVIPKESGLLYEEAANATQEILQKYDYYSQ